MQVQFSLISIGPQQRDIQDVCKALGIGLIAYSPLGLGMLTGKYDVSSGKLPKGPRGLLFRQILPGLQPLLSTMEAIAKERRKTVSQVGVSFGKSYEHVRGQLIAHLCVCPHLYKTGSNAISQVTPDAKSW